MCLLLISKKRCSLGCICLLYIACFQLSASQDLKEEHKEAIDNFNKLVKWPLAPLGSFASEVVEFTMTSSNEALHETLKKGGDSRLSFISQATVQSLSKQIGLAFGFVVGLLICLLLLFLPCCLVYYRHKQKKALETALQDSSPGKRIDHKSEAFLVFEIFIICIAVAAFGAVVVIIGSVRSYYTLRVPFGFANFTVQAAFQLKLKLLVNHQSRLNDVSRSAFDVIMLLHNVNEDIASDFMTRLKRMIEPTLNIATSIQWELIKVILLLENEQKLFGEFLAESQSNINLLIGRFKSSVEKLIETVGNQSSALDPLLGISEINFNNESVDSYSTPIPALREASKVSIQEGLQEITTKMKHIAISIEYDHSTLSETLKHVSFNVQKILAESTTQFVEYIKEHVDDDKREPLLEEIGMLQSDAEKVALFFNVVLLILSVGSLLLAIALAVTYHSGVCGTSCFHIETSNGKKVFSRSKTSHCSGLALLFLCYTISVFIWAIWLCCVLLFFLTSWPLTCCRAMNDLSILDMTFDSIKFRSNPSWYSLLTSDAFNMTLKETVTRCKSDSTFFPSLPDPLVDLEEATKIKSEIDFSNEVGSFSAEVKKINPLEDFTGFDIAEYDLTNQMNKIDINPPFAMLSNFLSNLKEMNVSETLDEIKADAESQDVTNLADTAVRVYDSMISNVSTALAKNETFSSKIKSAVLTVKAIEKHVLFLNWTGNELYVSMLNKSTKLFETSLNTTLSKVVDSVFAEMQLAAMDYRKSMSLCEAINLFYEKATAILCNVLLYPIACCWFGFFFLAVSLFIAIWLSSKSVMFFLYLPETSNDEEENRTADNESVPSDEPDSPAPKDEKDDVKEKEVEVKKAEDERGINIESDEGAVVDEDVSKPSEKQESPKASD